MIIRTTGTSSRAQLIRTEYDPAIKRGRQKMIGSVGLKDYDLELSLPLKAPERVQLDAWIAARVREDSVIRSRDALSGLSVTVGHAVTALSAGATPPADVWRALEGLEAALTAAGHPRPAPAAVKTAKQPRKAPAAVKAAKKPRKAPARKPRIAKPAKDAELPASA